MAKIIYLNAGNQFIIINNITFLDQRGNETIIHFTGGSNLSVNINKANLVDLIEKELQKQS